MRLRRPIKYIYLFNIIYTCCTLFILVCVAEIQNNIVAEINLIVDIIPSEKQKRWH